MFVNKCANQRAKCFCTYRHLLQAPLSKELFSVDFLLPARSCPS